MSGENEFFGQPGGPFHPKFDFFHIFDFSQQGASLHQEFFFSGYTSFYIFYSKIYLNNKKKIQFSIFRSQEIEYS